MDVDLWILRVSIAIVVGMLVGLCCVFVSSTHDEDVVEIECTEVCCPECGSPVSFTVQVY